MNVQLNYKSGVPVYLQIVEQVKAAAASGAVRAGEALPSIRPLAEELRVNRNTIAKAYLELESLGIIESQPGRGCFLAANHSQLKKQARVKMVSDEIDAAVVQAHHLQIGREDFLRLAEERYDFLAGKRAESEKENSNDEK